MGSVWEKADDAKILANLDIATVEGLFGANVVEKKGKIVKDNFNKQINK